MKKVLLTGSTGKLGKEIQLIHKNHNIELICPTSQEMNITDFEAVKNKISICKPDLVIHSAAYTDVKNAEKEIDKIIDINVIGTSNLVKACKLNDLKMVFISTDYVFDGEQGSYKTTDKINPVTKYAKSKASAELVARLYDKSLVIRTSFFGRDFPYDKALTDQWTSKDYVDVMAPKILKLALSDKFGIEHCASEKRTIYEIAKQRKPQVEKITRKDLDLATLRDTSLLNFGAKREKSLCFFVHYNSKGEVQKQDKEFLVHLMNNFTNIIILTGNKTDSFSEEVKSCPTITIVPEIPNYGMDFGKIEFFLKNFSQYNIENIDNYRGYYVFNNSNLMLRDPGPSLERMDAKQLDFWGYTTSNDFNLHVQSFFYYMSPEAFQKFIKWTCDMGPFTNRLSTHDIVTKMEVKLLKLFLDDNLKCGSYLPTHKLPIHRRPPHGNHSLNIADFLLLDREYPFIKKKAFDGVIRNSYKIEEKYIRNLVDESLIK